MDGETEAVGAYYGNARMKKADKEWPSANNQRMWREKREDGEDHKRGKETILGRRLPRSGFKTFIWVLGIAMMTFAFAALIRLQNGFFYD